jgi:uncharacterized protein YybS (DUF2232 family)
MALLGVRENKTWMTLGLLGATLTISPVFGSGFALTFLLGYGLLSYGLTLPLGKIEKGSESLLFCIVASIISKVLFVAVNVALRGSNPFEVDLNALSNMLHNMYAGMLSKGGQEAASLQESLDQAVALVPYMLPFFIILYSMFDSFINYRLCEALQRRREVTFPPLPPFGEWRFPKSLIYVLVFAFLLPFLVEGNDWSLWTMMEYNLKFIVNILFFLQGLALVWWGLSKYAANHFFPLPLRIVLIGFLSMPVMNTWIAALGFGDLCIDFRTKKIKRA